MVNPTNTERISGVEHRLNVLDNTVEALVNGMEGLEGRVLKIENCIADIEKGMTANHNELMSILRRQGAAENAQSGIRTTVVKEEQEFPSQVLPETPSKASKDEAVRLSISDKMKIWERKMTQNKVSAAGDYNFPSARQDFHRLHEKFPLTDDIEREMSLLSFDKAALKIANDTSREFPSITCSELWNILEDKLFNETQKKSKNTAFLNMKWDEKRESTSQFGERVNVLGTSLGLDKDMIQATFIKGLPNRLQSYAYTIQGGFDELVAAMTHISANQTRSEAVREVVETSMGSAVKSDISHQQSKKSTYRCFRCNDIGHMSWEKDKCKAYTSRLTKSGHMNNGQLSGNWNGRGPQQSMRD